MTKKKSASKASLQSAEKAAGDTASSRVATKPQQLLSAQQSTSQERLTEASASPTSLLICRNKHWRHTSSYHGPWLNLPPEVLESLAFSNFWSPRPRPIDPAVFFDLVKIRRLIDDATSLAVRAANGTTSAGLHTSLGAANGILNGTDAEILGIGSARGGGGGHHAKLSRERRHRMREHATQKLSHAYQLDEIAASVATMQAASAIDDVAKHVLQRNGEDADAQYVHFFHEKVPSLAMPQNTTLDPLNDVLRQKPTEASPYRTRAVARVFKDDCEAAVRDCTDGLAVYRLYHQPSQQQGLVVFNADTVRDREHRLDARVAEKDQPSGLEAQLLFHRAGAYLSLACDNVRRALDHDVRRKDVETQTLAADPPPPLEEKRAEARRLVRTYTKRALRDYTSFLSHLDYTPGLSADYTDAFLERLSSTTFARGDGSRGERLLDIDSRARSGLTEALAKSEASKDRYCGKPLPPPPQPKVYKLNVLFAAVPPDDLPSSPSGSRDPDPDHPVFSLPDFTEAVTYHPLLMDVLHSLLLCHCLLQTSTKEHLRHAHMVARIARMCDGYPVFLPARSPARADWIEVLRRSQNWLGLDDSWDSLCSRLPIAVSECKRQGQPKKRQAGSNDHSVLSERTTTPESPRADVRNKTLGGDDASTGSSPRLGSRDAGRGTSLRTERAEVIARWVTEAPPPTSAPGAGRQKKRSGVKARLKKTASTASSLREPGLEESVDDLNVVD
ncbi:hypothetical protein ABEF95_011672 [Exophiala dermatitidis]